MLYTIHCNLWSIKWNAFTGLDNFCLDDAVSSICGCDCFLAKNILLVMAIFTGSLSCGSQISST